jgi:hypothetical protein
MMVTMPLGAMRMKAPSEEASPTEDANASAIAMRASGGSTACSKRPPPAVAVAFRKARRDAPVADDTPAVRSSADFTVVKMPMIISPWPCRWGSAPPS